MSWDWYLQKWLEVCSKKTGEPPVCELCQYQYIRQKKFVVRTLLSPRLEIIDQSLSNQGVILSFHSINKTSLRSVTGECRASPAGTQSST